MSNDFLKTDTPNNWTREAFRVQQFTYYESELFKYLQMRNYANAIDCLKTLAVLQQEVIIEEVMVDGKKLKLKGLDAPTFKKHWADIEMLADRINAPVGYSDPVAKANALQERQTAQSLMWELVKQYQQINIMFNISYSNKNNPARVALQSGF